MRQLLNMFAAMFWLVPSVAFAQSDAATTTAGSAEASVEPEASVAPVINAEEGLVEDIYLSENNSYLPSRGAQAGGSGRDINDPDVAVGSVALHGFLNLEYIDSGRDGANNGVGSFDLHHVNLFVDGQLFEGLRTHLEIEIEHVKTLEIDQAYIEWRIENWLVLTGGRFYAPFGAERFVWYPGVNKLVSRPHVYRNIVPGSFYAMGLMASGNVGPSQELRLTYELSLTDGLGENALNSRRKSRSVTDNNADMALTGRVAAVYWPYVEVGASGHWQRYSSPSYNTSDTDLHSGEPKLYLGFVGTDISARYFGFELRGEFIRGWIDMDASGNQRVETGWFAQLAYVWTRDSDLLPELGAVVRVDGTDEDNAFSGHNDELRVSFGINIVPHSHFRIKLQYEIKDEKVNTAAGETNLKDDTFFAQFVADL